jgi:hypothetical protein
MDSLALCTDWLSGFQPGFRTQSIRRNKQEQMIEHSTGNNKEIIQKIDQAKLKLQITN